MNLTGTAIYGNTEPDRRRLILSTAFTAWFILVLFQSWTHVLWRDEVRAFSVALQGRNIPQMLRLLHGKSSFAHDIPTGKPALAHSGQRFFRMIMRSEIGRR